MPICEPTTHFNFTQVSKNIIIYYKTSKEGNIVSNYKMLARKPTQHLQQRHKFLTDYRQPITDSDKKCSTFPQIIFFHNRKSGIKHQQTLTGTGFSKATRYTPNVTRV